MVGSLNPFRRQAVNEMARGGMEDVGGRRFRKGRNENGAELYYCRRVFCGGEVAARLVLKELELTPRRRKDGKIEKESDGL